MSFKAPFMGKEIFWYVTDCIFEIGQQQDFPSHMFLWCNFDTLPTEGRSLGS